MNLFFFFGAAVLAAIGAQAQNTVVIQQQGKEHTTFVTQQGSANTTMVKQSTTGISNQAVISQVGTGNVATISQSNSDTTGSESGNSLGQSIHVTQSGEGDTVINQRDGTNHIFIQQGSEPTNTSIDKKKKRLGSKFKPENK